MEQKTNIQRQTAHKSTIRELKEGEYTKATGEWEPNYILTPQGRKISRTNIIGIIVSIQEEELTYSSFIIDDGTEKISIRSFENKDAIKRLQIGDPVLVIGRPRTFNNETYLTLEIVKKISNPKWIELRKLELNYKQEEVTEKTISMETHKKENTIKEETITEDSEKITQPGTEEDPTELEKLIEIIKSSDKGEGADTEELIAQQGPSTEEHIKRLLEQGEIFEIKPGRVKVLE